MLPARAHLGAVRTALTADHGLRNAFVRLYCISATLRCASGVMVPPKDGGLSELLQEVQSDLDDGIALLKTCLELIAPLHQLPAESGCWLIGASAARHKTDTRRSQPCHGENENFPLPIVCPTGAFLNEQAHRSARP